MLAGSRNRVTVCSLSKPCVESLGACDLSVVRYNGQRGQYESTNLKTGKHSKDNKIRLDVRIL
jgi:hypothetical protein